ncbi:MAG: hypothetical protein JXA24_04750 [Proteobacteria bacterium]|nr:hypothetical protein [Pseudomonadota bacterium]
MAARTGFGVSQCITPVLFSMEMERTLGPINMVPVGFKGGAIEFAGLSDGRPKRQPLVRIDGGKFSAEFIYRSAAIKSESAEMLLDKARGLDAFMDEKVVLPSEAKIGRRVFQKEMTVRQLAGMSKRNMRPEISDIIEGATERMLERVESDPESLHKAINYFNAGVLTFARASNYARKFNSAELFLYAATILFKQENFPAAAIAGEYAQELFGTLNPATTNDAADAGALASDAWLRSVEEFWQSDWPGFLIGIRYGLLCAMKSGDSRAMESFHDYAARYYEKQRTGYWTIASAHRLRAAVSVLQGREWRAEDWRRVGHHLHAARKALESAYPLQRERIRNIAALSRIAEGMSGR